MSCFKNLNFKVALVAIGENYALRIVQKIASGKRQFDELSLESMAGRELVDLINKGVVPLNDAFELVDMKGGDKFVLDSNYCN